MAELNGGKVAFFAEQLQRCLSFDIGAIELCPGHDHFADERGDLLKLASLCGTMEWCVAEDIKAVGVSSAGDQVTGQKCLKGDCCQVQVGRSEAASFGHVGAVFNKQPRKAEVLQLN